MTSTELRHIRTRLRLTQAGLGRLLGVHWMTISRWERGVGAIDLWRAELLRVAASRPDAGDDACRLLRTRPGWDVMVSLLTAAKATP